MEHRFPRTVHPIILRFYPSGVWEHFPYVTDCVVVFPQRDFNPYLMIYDVVINSKVSLLIK